MPLPLFLGIGAAVAGVAGTTNAVKGAKKIKRAKGTNEMVKKLNERNLARYKASEKTIKEVMGALGKHELTILKSFGEFVRIYEKNRQ